MTCKECIHYDAACINGTTGACMYFKDKSRYIELPCKVGDTVYKICPISTFIKVGQMWDGRKVKTDCDRCPYHYCDCHDIGYRRGANNIVHEMQMRDVIQIVRVAPYFGKIYFLTREEAEKALKERERE